MEVFRAFLFAKVTSSEIQAADNLLPSLPTDRKLCGEKVPLPNLTLDSPHIRDAQTSTARSADVAPLACD